MEGGSIRGNSFFIVKKSVLSKAHGLSGTRRSFGGGKKGGPLMKTRKNDAVNSIWEKG